MLKRFATALAAVALLAAAPAAAQDAYPSKPVRLIVPFPAGGNNDIMGRLIANYLTEKAGYRVVVDNRVGGSGTLGTDMAVRTPPDGYTLLLGGHAVLVIAAQTMKGLTFDVFKDLTPIAGIASQSLVLAVHPSVKANTVPELIALSKSMAGKINYASNGNASSTHLSAEMFKAATGADFTHVPYRGDAPAVIDLLGGQVEVMFGNFATIVPHAREGKLRLLAVTSKTRAPMVPEVPTMAEAGVPGYESYTWFGLLGPAGMPPALAAKINADVNAALASPEIRKRLAELGVDAMPTSVDGFAKLMRDEWDRWDVIIRKIGLTQG